MAETDAVIRISANGADEASAAIGSVTKSMQGIGATHNDLVGKFSQRFEHVGLQLFAGEALRANGVGMETRAVVQTLGLGLTTLAGSFGAAAAPIFLVVTAFAAVAGIVEKVIAHHKDLSDSLDKTNKSTDEQLKKTNETITSIEAYRAEVGSVPPVIDQWEQAERNLMKAQVERQISGDKAQLASLQALVQEDAKRQDQVKQQIADQVKIIASLKTMTDDTVLLGAQQAQLKKLNDQFTAGAMTAEEHRAKVAELRAEIELLGSNGSDDIKKLTEEMVKSAEEGKKETEEFQKMAEEHVKAIQKEADAETKRYQEWANHRAEQVKKHKDFADSEVEIEENAAQYQEHVAQWLNKEIASSAKQAFDSMAGAVGDSFAKMFVEGKSFTESMQTAFKSMAEKIIADIIRIEIEWLALKALGFAAGGPIGGMLMQAEGGSYLVNQPTMFMAGEAGQPEIASFTPLSKLGSGGQDLTGISQTGANIQIGSLQTNVYGVDDPDAIADQVGRKIIERIRGMGEVNFARSA